MKLKYKPSDTVYVVNTYKKEEPISIHICKIDSIITDSKSTEYWLSDKNGTWGDSIPENNIDTDFNALVKRFTFDKLINK